MNLELEPVVGLGNNTPKPELILMYTWDINGYYDNKVCGHMYEIIEYYYILKDEFDIKIIFPENYNLEMVLSKYTFTLVEKIELSNCIIQRPKSGIIKTKGGKGLVLVVDGNLGNFKGIIYGIPIQFSCGKLGLIPKDKRAWYLLHDKRICEEQEFEGYQTNPPIKTFNYNKRILFEKFYKDTRYHPNIQQSHILFYLTENCKYQTEEDINGIIKKYLDQSLNIITIVTDYEFDKTKLEYPANMIQLINIKENPINIFNIPFTHYFYTNVKRQWDCSNRLIAECDFHNRNIFFVNDYQDNALVIRRFDIEHRRNFSLNQKEEACMENYLKMPYNLNLTKNDIIKFYLNEILQDIQYEK